MDRPRIKPGHNPYRTRAGDIRIGGIAYGVAAEISDPTGAAWTLLQAMDGSHDLDQIVNLVVTAHPDAPDQAVRGSIERLIAAGYVEDVGALAPPELTERDKERYERSRRFYRCIDRTPRVDSWEPQVALHHAQVTVVGLGGTGGSAAMALAASGVGSLTCVDLDTIELSNLNRQVIYAEADIGRSKVDARWNAYARSTATSRSLACIGRSPGNPMSRQSWPMVTSYYWPLTRHSTFENGPTGLLSRPAPRG